MELGDVLAQLVGQFGPLGWVVGGLMLYMNITWVRQRTANIEASADARQKDAYTRLMDQQREDNRAYMEKLETLRRDQVQMQARVQTVSEQNDELTRKLASAERKISEQAGIIDSLQLKVGSMAGIISDLESQKAGSQHDLEAERMKLRELEGKYRASEMRVQELERKVTRIEAERDTLFRLFEMLKPKEVVNDAGLRVGGSHPGGGGAGAADGERAAGAQIGGGERESVPAADHGTDQAAAGRRDEPGGADAQQGG